MKKILIFVLLPLMLLGGGGAGLFFSGMLGGGEEAAGEATEEKPKRRVRELRENPIYYELADLVISVRDEQDRRRFMIMKVSVEVDQEQDSERIKLREDEIRDKILVLMSRQNMETLNSPEEIYRLREQVEDSVFALFEENEDMLLGVDIRNVRIQ